MMIKIGRTAVINMKAIRSVHVGIHTENTTEEVSGGFWGKTKKKVEKKSYAVTVYYLDSTDKETHYLLYGFKDVQSADEVKNEVLSQIKELELESMTMTVENAIRNS